MASFYTSVVQWGSKILYRGFENGRRVTHKIDYSPTLYTQCKQDTGYKTLTGENVEPRTFDSIGDAKEFCKTYDEVDGIKIYGMQQYAYQCIADKFPNEIKFEMSDMRILAFDIETACENGFPAPDKADEAVLLISVQRLGSKHITVWGWKDFNKTPSDDFEYRQFKDEVSMLRNFITFWQSDYPDAITGWNTDGFDVPYLINRISRLMGEDNVNRLSPWNIVNSREIHDGFGKRTAWDIVGIVHLDYLDLYKKFTYNARESYALGFIAQEELGETKLEIEGSFKNAYTNHWDQFVRYNAKDTELITKMENKLKFIELAFTIAYLAKCNIKDVYGPVKTWDVFIYNYLKAKNVVIPPSDRHSAGEIEGAYVKEPVPGMYGWTISFDFASLYPTIIRQWNMSPEKLIGVASMDVAEFISLDECLPEFLDKNVSVAANGAMFSREEMGIIPEVVKVVVDGRKIAKKQMISLEQKQDDSLKSQIASLNGKQMAFKILANALYGALGNAGFRYYDRRIAEAITLTGQACNKHAEKSMNGYMNKLLKTEGVDYVVYMDTDSAYLNVDPIVKKLYTDKSVEELVLILDKIGHKVQEGPIKASTDKVFEIGNCFESLMDMKREAISSKAIWTGKKRYAMMVHNSEGVDYKPYKLKVMGMDLVKSSTPKKVRKLLKDALIVIFEKDQVALHKTVADMKKDFMGWDVSEIAFPRGVNDLSKYADKKTTYKKGCPIHVRAALLYNKLAASDTELPQIADGDKIKFAYLMTPNIIGEDIIAFPSESRLPKTFGLDKYIAWDKMWEKTFIKPLEGITGAMKWTTEKKASLEDFFC